MECECTEFFGRAFARRSHREGRQVGLECEFIVVDHVGAAVSREVVQDVLQGLHDRGFQLVRDSWTRDVILAKRDVGGVRGGEETVATELGYPTIEITVPPAPTVFDAGRRLDRILTLVAASFAANGCLVLGYGMQPLTPPGRALVSRKSRYLLYERFSQHRFVPSQVGADIHLFTVTAATHCHVDVGLSEAVRAVNVLNALAGVQIALTANSPIWKGSVDPRWKAVREHFYDQVYDAADWPSGLPCGVPRPFRDLVDYVGVVLGAWAPLVERDSEALALEQHPMTVREFMKAPAVRATSIGGEVVTIVPQPSDIVSFARLLEFDARLSPAFGTVESRISCAQPPGAAVEVAALALGLVENLAEAEALTEGISVEDRRRLRIAGARHGLAFQEGDREMYRLVEEALRVAGRGLQRRGHGEQRLLDGFWARLPARTTHADEAIAVFNASGLGGLLELRGHRP